MAAKRKTTNTTDIVDIDLSPIRKKRFRINNDDNRVLELNVNDMNIIPRLEESTTRLQDIQKRVAEEMSADDNDLAKNIKKLDDEMRSVIDYIFDSNVSEICVPDGSMFDLHNGEFTFEHILDALSKLYEDAAKKELAQRLVVIKKHTEKYGK